MKSKCAKRTVPIRFATVVAAVALASSVAADDNEWVYDTSGREEPAPATAGATMLGLDARTRGLADSASCTVDKWYWSRDDSNACLVRLRSPGLCLMLK